MAHGSRTVIQNSMRHRRRNGPATTHFERRRDMQFADYALARPTAGCVDTPTWKVTLGGRKLSVERPRGSLRSSKSVEGRSLITELAERLSQSGLVENPDGRVIGLVGDGETLPPQAHSQNVRLLPNERRERPSPNSERRRIPQKQNLRADRFPNGIGHDRSHRPHRSR